MNVKKSGLAETTVLAITTMDHMSVIAKMDGLDNTAK